MYFLTSDSFFGVSFVDMPLRDRPSYSAFPDDFSPLPVVYRTSFFIEIWWQEFP